MFSEALIGLNSLSCTFRNHGYLAIFGQADDVHRDASGTQESELALGRLGQKDLGDGVAAGEVDQRFGGVRAFEHAGFDVQFAREFKMLLQRDGIGRGHDADREAIGFQIIRDAASAADQAG